MADCQADPSAGVRCCVMVPLSDIAPVSNAENGGVAGKRVLNVKNALECVDKEFFLRVASRVTQQVVHWWVKHYVDLGPTGLK